jgi:uncharacterized RDD family membrane protein YckC
MKDGIAIGKTDPRMSIDGRLKCHAPQCAITGKIVPEDELVEIQGQRVCAEGKAILMARLASGEAMPGELDRPTVLRRFGCIFLDGLIIGVPLVIIQAAVGGGAPAAGPTVVAGFIALVGWAVQLFYFGAMHAAGGQTVGKKAGKTMVVNLDGSAISPTTAYIRAFAYIGPNVLSAIALLLGSVALVGIASLIVGLWFLTDVIMALVDTDKQRSLHDRIAGTRVVVKP